MSSPIETGPASLGSVGDRSLGDLISEVTTDLSTAGYFVLLFASIALWWAIGAATGLGWSAVIVAIIWGIIAAVLAAMGRKSLRDIRGLPKTADTVKRIPDALKGNEIKPAFSARHTTPDVSPTDPDR